MIPGVCRGPCALEEGGPADDPAVLKSSAGEELAEVVRTAGLTEATETPSILDGPKQRVMVVERG